MSDFEEKLKEASRGLMVVHGAALGILLSQVGSALDHPELFKFLTWPMGLAAIGFVCAFMAYQVLIFDPPPDHPITKFVAFFPVWLSGTAIVLMFLLGLFGYAELAAPAIAALPKP